MTRSSALAAVFPPPPRARGHDQRDDSIDFVAKTLYSNMFGSNLSRVPCTTTGELFMYAIIETGGKQYRIREGDVLRIEKVEGEPGQEVLLDRILLIGNGEGVRVGAPFLEDVRVRAEILAQRRGRKVVVFKFKRRKDHRKKQGHRQDYTGIRIKAIEPVQHSAGEGEARDGT